MTVYGEPREITITRWKQCVISTNVSGHNDCMHVRVFYAHKRINALYIGLFVEMADSILVQLNKKSSFHHNHLENSSWKCQTKNPSWRRTS
jgi:hypothetical protein